ncbi:MAG TPA: molybdopterin cofactor-binding domain-containing protein, partial [Kofleriaceae bacterium]|nr:molybdopterin cofactor-binding domain-containing protein [Kofleriaceae bacterium]
MTRAREPLPPFEITRRSFLAGLGAAATGLALGVRFSPEAEAGTTAGAAAFAPNPFVQIGTDGVVTIVCHRSEMGQGIRSSLPVLIADELGADPAKVRILQGDGDPRYGDQNTDGSTSIRNHYEEMRAVGAAARMMLVAAAAKRLRAPEARLIARDDAVHDPVTKKSISFGELAAAAAKLPVPARPVLRPAKELARVGTALPLVDGPDYVTGAAKYGADIRLPGMLVAVIARPPVVLGRIAHVDDAKARAVPGVKRIVQLGPPTAPVKFQPLGGVAVLAEHTWAAMRGRAALDITWDHGPNASYDSAEFGQGLLAAVRASGEPVRKLGDAAAALAGAAKVVEAEYVVPHLVHAPMEPPAAVARVDGGRCEIWASTQDPQTAQEEVAAALALDKANVTVHVTFLGGGFGRKSKPDYIVEAALLAREANAPVRVQWTREDELRHAYYHTHSAQALAAGLDAGGNVIAWRHRLASPSISSTFAPNAVRPSRGELNQGVVDFPLDVPNVAVETGEAQAHARIGWMRSVCNVQHAFAVQSFIDELATATRRDPRDMLLRVLGKARTLAPADLGIDEKLLANYGAPIAKHPIDVARFHRVIEKVTAMAGWDAAKKAGRPVGLAVHRSFLSYIAVVAQVSTGARGELRVDEAWIAADCGTIINADRVRAQLEGAFLFAQSSMMHGAITMKAGAVQQRSFRDYPLVRMPAAPRR